MLQSVRISKKDLIISLLHLKNKMNLRVSLTNIKGQHM